MFILKILVLVAMIRLLLATNKPFLCSAIYAGFGLLFGFIGGLPLNDLVLATVVAFMISSIYFYLLDRFESAGLLWWLKMVAGLALGFV